MPIWWVPSTLAERLEGVGKADNHITSKRESYLNGIFGHEIHAASQGCRLVDFRAVKDESKRGVCCRDLYRLHLTYPFTFKWEMKEDRSWTLPSIQAIEAHSLPLSGPSPQPPAHPNLRQLQVHIRLPRELCHGTANHPYLTIATTQHIQNTDTLHTRLIRGFYAAKKERKWPNETTNDESVSKKRSMIRDFIKVQLQQGNESCKRTKILTGWYTCLSLLRKSLK